MRFIDLFSGLGGFHLALKKLGHSCVFASEINKDLQEVYSKNFGIRPVGDIRKTRESDIPPHEILCAGFPCQPFSKAGRQYGFGDPNLGRLYEDILRILSYHHPRYFILENVPNLENHDEGKTWQKIRKKLDREGYYVQTRKFSPHHFGIPQIRERIYIVGSTQPLDKLTWPSRTVPNGQTNIRKILEKKPVEARPISKTVADCLGVWQSFLDLLPDREKIPHPLWSMEFKATYPYEDKTPYALSAKELRKYRGSFGRLLTKGKTRREIFSMLPSHARREQRRFPQWKVQFIRNNRRFYRRNRHWINAWLPKILKFPSSFQKLEWNCTGERDMRLGKYILQLRASGVRVKRPTTAPSLVAMTTTQAPIVAWEKRYITPSECKRLQSMEKLRHLPKNMSAAYNALGNAVNVDVARRVAEMLVGKAGNKQAEIKLATAIRRQ